MKRRSAGLWRAAAASAAVFGLGLLPTFAGPFDAHGALAWCTFWVVPTGILVGASRSPVGMALGSALGLGAVLVALSTWGTRAVPSLPLAGLVLLAGLGLGVGLGALLGRQRAPQAAALAVVGCLCLVGLATGGGLFPSPPAVQRPALGSLLLDLSPVTVVLECAGLDWERHPAIYGPAGTDWFSGERRPYRGMRFAPLALAVGALAAAGGTLVAARTKRDPGALP